MKFRLTEFLFTGNSRRIPLLFVLFSTLYTFNFELDDWEINLSFFTSLLTALGIAFVILWGCEKWVGQKQAGDLAATCILIYLFHFEDWRGIIPDGSFLAEIMSRYKYVIPVSLVLMAGIVLLFRKWRVNWDLPVRYANGLFGILVSFQLMALLFHLHAQSKNETSLHHLSLPGIVNARNDSLPDVYFTIFDSRTSSEALASYWNFNDSVYLNELHRRKFTVIKNGKSNYITTSKSLASTLNMNYLHDLAKVHPDLEPPRINLKNINNSEVVHVFKKLGYEFHNLSPFKIGGEPSFYSRSLEKPFTLRLWYKTLPGKIVSETNILSLFKTTLQPILFKGSTKAGIVENLLATLYIAISKPTVYPKFVYTHFMLPHFPFIYRKDGSQFSINESLNTKTKERYLEQLQYVNTLALQIADSILQHSSGNAIIIIQGDHGYRLLKEKFWQSDEADCITNAWYIPDSYVARPYAGMTPVNTFRFVFDSLFKIRCGLLPDSSFNSKADLQVDH